MNILFHNYYEDLNDNNRLFEQRNAAIGDDLLRPFQVLKEEADNRDITVGTRSVISLEQADAIIFVDLPNTSYHHVQKMIDSGKPLYLIVLESILVRPVNKNDDSLSCFQKIFTYNDSMVDCERFIKINYSFDLPTKIHADLSNKEKLCVMIAGNKRFTHPLELYSERIKAIRWFEKNHPDDFDLYGIGWDQHPFGKKLPIRVLNRFKLLNKFMAPSYPSYRGGVERKNPVLERYKFAICYENVKDVPGYITEKIFDCFFAGCIPIYFGANNISDYVPHSCYIDKRLFSSYEQLFNFMLNMDDRSYFNYLESIKAYLASYQAMQFSSIHFSNTILNNI